MATPGKTHVIVKPRALRVEAWDFGPGVETAVWVATGSGFPGVEPATPGADRGVQEPDEFGEREDLAAAPPSVEAGGEFIGCWHSICYFAPSDIYYANPGDHPQREIGRGPRVIGHPEKGRSSRPDLSSAKRPGLWMQLTTGVRRANQTWKASRILRS